LNNLHLIKQGPIYRIDSNQIKPLILDRNSLRAYLTNKLANLEVNGTLTKYYAHTGQDIINKNGKSMNVVTLHQCITRMKEYELKSLEELRFEDYQAKRYTKKKISVEATAASAAAAAATNNDLLYAEKKIKMISDSIQNVSFHTGGLNSPSTHLKKTKHELINYFNSLQNEIDYRTDLSINRLNTYRYKMIKNIEMQKKAIQIDDQDRNNNETIVRNNALYTNNLTIRNNNDSCNMSNLISSLFTHSSDDKSINTLDTTSSLTHLTFATSTNSEATEARAVVTTAIKANKKIKNESVFSLIIFSFFFIYIFLWFILCKKIKLITY